MMRKKEQNTVFRTITVTKPPQKKYPPNIIRNQKYSVYNFMFVVLFNQFKHFFNVYFFFVSFSQVFKVYQIGPWISNIAPWVFVLFLTLGKEGIDDFQRYIRDKEANSEKYKKVTRNGIEIAPSSMLQVGDLILLEKNQRVPADMVVLKTQEDEGQCFIRTDQLDGETDWKLRNAVSATQTLNVSHLFKKVKGQDANTAEVLSVKDEVDLPEIVNETEAKFEEVNIAQPKESAFNTNEKLAAEIMFNENDNVIADGISHTGYNTTGVIKKDANASAEKSLRKEEEQNEKINDERMREEMKAVFENEKHPLYDQKDDTKYEEEQSESSVKEFKSAETNQSIVQESEDRVEVEKELQDVLKNDEDTEETDSSEKKDGGDSNAFTIDNQTNIQNNRPEITIQDSTLAQMKGNTSELFDSNITIYADMPHKNIYSFIGKLTVMKDGELLTEPLNLENVIWMNTVLATQGVIGCVIYTGKETRAMMNTAHPRNKFGKIDEEINFYSILLCICSVAAACVFLFFSGISSRFDITLVRFIIIFSSVIPISLKVTIDVARMFFYSNWIMQDEDIPGCIVRNSNIPEELGRITYLLSDKTGTLTRNEMEMKKVHVGTICYTTETNDEITEILRKKMFKKHRRTWDLGNKVFELVRALALCHNVTPVEEDGKATYQASSPDEIAIVQWCEAVGIALQQRTKDRITIRILDDVVKTYKVLYIFPFTSDTKRMGIIVRDIETKELFFFLKGADMVMKTIVQKNDWLDEEVDNMAREGLRTLVIGMKKMSQDEFDAFEKEYKTANLSINNRNEEVQRVVVQLEKNLTLLGLTGVEDKLQENVCQSLEDLRNAGVKIWMLTGDKIETAISISISSRLFLKRNRYEILRVNSRAEANELKERIINYIIVDGSSLQIMIDNFMSEFITFAATLDTVVCCRCTPTQKALVARNLRMLTSHRVACIGDGGNDVSMITEANVGIGIVGKEGNQASLAADFSILKFSDITTLLFWHGRNCYKGTAKLIQFIIHRGTVISVMQGIFSAVFLFSPIALYQGAIMVGYVCVYTMCPMWCIILDRDVRKAKCFEYPELYKEMVQTKILSAKSFASWNLISFYQGSIIMLITFLRFEHELLSIVCITFSCLVVNELLVLLLMVSSINRWMVFSQVISILAYILSFFFLKNQLKLPNNIPYFLGNLTIISIIAILFSFIDMLYSKYVRPPSYTKIEKIVL